MIAFFKFNLDKMDDKEAFKRCTKALDLCAALYEIDQSINWHLDEAGERTKARKAIKNLQNDYLAILSRNNIDLEADYLALNRRHKGKK